jgi:rhodanese-related sulfurtransferase
MPCFRRHFIRRALAAAAIVVLPLSVSGAGPDSLDLSAPEARARAAAGEVVLIDIRRPDEWRATGVAEGATRIDMLHPGGAEGFTRAVLERVEADRNAPIALICRTGNRSTQVQRYLLAQGFTRVYNVREGMAGSAAGPGWLSRGLPIEACKQC